MPDRNFDLRMKIEEPHCFIQWKGTDVCMDFWCDCGAHNHYDGGFAYTIKCPDCGTVWEMPSHVFPRKATGDRLNLGCEPLEPIPD